MEMLIFLLIAVLVAENGVLLWLYRREYSPKRVTIEELAVMDRGPYKQRLENLAAR